MKNLLPANKRFYCVKQLSDDKTEFFIMRKEEGIYHFPWENLPIEAIISNPLGNKVYEVKVFNTQHISRLALCANLNSLGGFSDRLPLDEEEEALYSIIIEVVKLEKAHRLHASSDYIGLNFYKKCASCGRIEKEVSMYSHGEELVCYSCKQALPRCEACGRILRIDEVKLCEDCVVKKELQAGCAHDMEEDPLFDGNTRVYSYHGAPCFERRFFRIDGVASSSAFLEKDDLPFMGVELELESYYGTSVEPEDFVESVLEDYSGLVHFEEDSSINYGVELIGEPCTLRYYEEAGSWKDIFGKMEELTDSDRTGLHVHVSKRYFGEVTRDRQEAIARLIYLVKALEDDLHFISGRSSDCGDYHGTLNFDTFSIKSGFDLGFEYSQYLKAETSRYRNLNLNPRNTIEFRLFAATTDFNVFIERLKVVAYMCYASRHFSFEKLQEFGSLDSLIECVEATINEGM